MHYFKLFYAKDNFIPLYTHAVSSDKIPTPEHPYWYFVESSSLFLHTGFDVVIFHQGSQYWKFIGTNRFKKFDTLCTEKSLLIYTVLEVYGNKIRNCYI